MCNRNKEVADLRTRRERKEQQQLQRYMKQTHKCNKQNKFIIFCSFGIILSILLSELYLMYIIKLWIRMMVTRAKIVSNESWVSLKFFSFLSLSLCVLLHSFNHCDQQWEKATKKNNQKKIVQNKCKNFANACTYTHKSAKERNEERKAKQKKNE